MSCSESRRASAAGASFPGPRARSTSTSCSTAIASSPSRGSSFPTRACTSAHSCSRPSPKSHLKPPFLAKDRLPCFSPPARIKKWRESGADRDRPLQARAAPAAESAAPDAARTLAEVLEWHLARHSDRLHLVLQDDQGREQTVTYAQLDGEARAIAAGLHERGLEPGRAVAIMLPTSAEYFHSFLGVLLAGGIPVPIYPPARASQLDEHVRRHVGILSNALTEFLITVPQAKPVVLLLKPRVATLKSVVTPQELARPGASGTPYKPKS